MWYTISGDKAALDRVHSESDNKKSNAGAGDSSNSNNKDKGVLDIKFDKLEVTLK
jgi:hypothetical protein